MEVELREAQKSLKEVLCHQTQHHVHILYVPQNKDLIPTKCKNVTKSMIERN
jgi:hypothetical protein